MVEVASKVCVQRMLNGCPSGPKCRPGSAQRVPKGAQGCPKGAQKVAKGIPAVPKGAQRVPKVCPREPKGPHQRHNHEQTHKRAKEQT